MTLKVRFQVQFPWEVGHKLSSRELVKWRVTAKDMQMGGLLAEKPKNDADDDEHESHTNKNTNHRRVDILEIGFFLLLGWNNIYIATSVIKSIVPAIITIPFTANGLFISNTVLVSSLSSLEALGTTSTNQSTHFHIYFDSQFARFPRRFDARRRSRDCVFQFVKIQNDLYRTMSFYELTFTINAVPYPFFIHTITWRTIWEKILFRTIIYLDSNFSLSSKPLLIYTTVYKSQDPFSCGLETINQDTRTIFLKKKNLTFFINFQE